MKKQRLLLPSNLVNIILQGVLLSALTALLISCGWEQRPLDETGDPTTNTDTANTDIANTDIANTDTANTDTTTQGPTPNSSSFAGGMHESPDTIPHNTPTPNAPGNPVDVVDDDTSAPETPVEPIVSFENVVKPLLQNYCISCHDPNPSVSTHPLAAAARKIDWLDYETTIENKDNLLSKVWTLKNEPTSMPFVNTPGQDEQTITPEQREKIKVWVESI